MGPLFKIIKPVIWLGLAAIMFAGSLFTSDFSWEVLKIAVMSPFSVESLKTLAAPVAGLITSVLAFIGFFAQPASKTDVDDINKNIDKTRDEVTETRTIVQGEGAKTRLVIKEEMAKAIAALSPDETKSFDEAFQDVLTSSDARKAPAREALVEGRIEDAGDQILKIARQEHAASDDMTRTTQGSYREAGALFYPIHTAKALEGYVGAINAGSKEAWDHIYAARLYVRMGQIGEAEKILASAENLSLTPRDQSIIFNERGNLSISGGDLPSALRYFEDGLEIRKGLAAGDPTHAGYQRDLSVSYGRLGDVSVSGGDLPSALRYFEKDLEIAKGLAAGDPTNAEYQRDLIVSYSKLAGVDPDNALSWWKKAKVVCDAMIAKDQLAPVDAFIPDLIARNIAELE